MLTRILQRGLVFVPVISPARAIRSVGGGLAGAAAAFCVAVLLLGSVRAEASSLFGSTGFTVVRENGGLSEIPPGSLAGIDLEGLGTADFPDGSSNAPGGATLIADVFDSPEDGPLQAIDFSAGGQLFGAACDDFTCEFAAGPSELLQIDPVTGVATSIGPIRSGSFDISIAGLAFQPGTDTLFGVSGFLHEPDFCEHNCLFTIDPLTAAATLVGQIPLGFGTPGGLAFAPDGTLYLTTVTPIDGLSNAFPLDLVTIDPLTGAISSREAVLLEQQFNFTAGGSPFLAFTIALQGLTVAPDGRLIASGTNGNTTLFERVFGQVMSPSGTPVGDEGYVWRLLGDSGENITDLAFAPIPEPSALALLALGMTGLAVARSR